MMINSWQEKDLFLMGQFFRKIQIKRRALKIKKTNFKNKKLILEKKLIKCSLCFLQFKIQMIINLTIILNIVKKDPQQYYFKLRNYKKNKFQRRTSHFQK